MSSAPDPEELRVGTAEREESAKLLAEHYSEGRLSAEEYESRVLDAYNAKTRTDLRPLFTDLPAPHPGFLAAAPAAAPTYQMPYPAPMPYAMPMPVPMVVSPKSKVAAGVLQIVLPFGAGRFYTGHIGLAIAQLLVVLVTFGVGTIWPIIDGIVLLAGGGTDSLGRQLRD